MMSHEAQSAEAGFTLVEILVALTVLLVGMAGIIGLFSTGLTLERRSTLAIDTAVALRDIEPQIKAEITTRLAAGVDVADLSTPRSPIPGWQGLDYLTEVLPLPGSETNEGYLLKITVVPRGVQEDKGFSYGFLPIRLGQNYERLIKEAGQETLENKK